VRMKRAERADFFAEPERSPDYV
jgi:hypothetical protein